MTDTNPDDIEPSGGVALGAWLQDRQAQQQAAANVRFAQQRAEAQMRNPLKVDTPQSHLRGQVTEADLDAIHQHRAEAHEVLQLTKVN